MGAVFAARNPLYENRHANLARHCLSTAAGGGRREADPCDTCTKKQQLRQSPARGLAFPREGGV